MEDNTKFINVNSLKRFWDNLKSILDNKQNISDDNLLTNNKSIVSAINEIYNKNTFQESMLNITYSELKSLKDNGGLIPGLSYRIIDYVTLTKASDIYHSAQNQFDIIVIADSTNTLNEHARAIQHDGDEYFKNSNLSAWKLKYKLDNDTTYWVDDTCKGVIYEMTDEFNNTCPYDFKNILQARYKVTGTGSSRADGKYLGWFGCKYIADNTEDHIFCHTFSKMVNGVSEDASLNKSTNREGNIIQVNENKIKDFKMGDVHYPNDICFLCNDDISNTVCKKIQNIILGDFNYNMTFGPQCYDIITGGDCKNMIFTDFDREIRILDYCGDMIFGRDMTQVQIGGNVYNILTDDSCFSFKIGNECSGIKLGNNCRRFTIGNYCRNCTMGNNCQIITTGDNCSDWSTGNNCSFWSCGNQCYNWSVGNDCTSWSVGNGSNNWSTGNNCKRWSVGNECSRWSVGIDCYDWSAGNNCYNWSTKNYCQSWSVGNDCHTWSVGNNCVAWSAGNRCYNWVFGAKDTPKDYFNSITIENYNHNFCLNTVYTTSSSKICRGIHIAEMAFASLTDWTNYGLTEVNGNVNQLYCTTIGKSGDKKLNVT
jgi:hypothetical protein